MDNKQFVTLEELDKLNANDLIGTEMLSAYMHGYLIDMKLYYKLKSLAEPFDFNEYRKERVKKKMEEKAAERITIRKKLPKVNEKLAEQLLDETNDKKNFKGAALLEDNRFSALFNDTKFEINVENEDYLRLNRRGRREKKEVKSASSESSDQDLDESIVPKLPKKRKIQDLDLHEEHVDEEEDKPFRERMEEKKTEKPKMIRKRKPKVLTEKPDLKDRRPIVPLDRLLRSK